MTLTIKGHEICDFCRGIPVHVFECPTFTVPNVGPEKNVDYTSVGEWAACATCRNFILADAREALLNRSMFMFMETVGVEMSAEDVAGMRDDLKRTHAKFFELKTGDYVGVV